MSEAWGRGEKKSILAFSSNSSSVSNNKTGREMKTNKRESFVVGQWSL